MILNDCVLVQVIPLIIQDKFYTIQNLQRSPFHKLVIGQDFFFAVSYSKPAGLYIFCLQEIFVKLDFEQKRLSKLITCNKIQVIITGSALQECLVKTP